MMMVCIGKYNKTCPMLKTTDMAKEKNKQRKRYVETRILSLLTKCQQIIYRNVAYL